MKGGGIIALGVLFGVAGCSVSLDLESAQFIQCVSDGDCPLGQVCAPTIGRCRDGVDDEAPTITSAVASSPTRIELVFSEPILEATLVTTSIVLTPALEISAVSVEGDGNRLVLTTVPQLQGYPYAGIANVQDLFGNEVANPAFTVNGFGAAVDSSAPVILAPVDGKLIGSQDVTLAWSAPRGALQFEVEVATDAAFTQTVSGYPATFSQDELTAVATGLDDVDYYWRVRTELSDWAVGTFAVAAQAVHVFCPMGEACDETAGTQTGARTSPLRSFAKAVALASENGIPSIRIAARGGGEAYPEPLALEQTTLEVLGGYEPSFSNSLRDPTANVTVLSSSSIPHIINAPLGPLTLSGITLRYDRAASNVLAVTMNVGEQSLIAEDLIVEVSGGTNQVSAVTLGGTSMTAMVELRRSTIRVLGSPEFAIGIVAAGIGTLRLTDSVLDFSAATPGTGAVGLQAIGMDAELDNVDIALSSLTGLGAIGMFGLGGDLTVTNTRIEAVGAFTATAANIEGGAHLIFESSVVWGAADGQPALFVATDATADVRNNVLGLVGDPMEYSSIFRSAGTGVIQGTHNTVVVNDAWLGRSEEGGSLILTNNLVGCTGTRGGVIVENSSPVGVYPTSMQNNAFVNCPVFLRDEIAPTDITDIASLNAVDGGAGTCDGERIEGNLSITDSLDAILLDFDGPDDDVTTFGDNAPDLANTAATTVIADGGRVTSAIDCGACGALVTCGDVTLDASGGTRPSPPSIGAFEP